MSQSPTPNPSPDQKSTDDIINALVKGLVIEGGGDDDTILFKFKIGAKGNVHNLFDSDSDDDDDDGDDSESDLDSDDDTDSDSYD
jgi:hypothetical protein